MSVSETITALWRYLDAQRNVRPVSPFDALRELARGNIPGEVTAELIESLIEVRAPAELGELTTPTIVTDFFAGLARIVQPRSVLDPTCGTGTTLERVGSAVSSANLQGIDINADSCEIARQVLGSAVTVVEGDVLSERLEVAAEYDFIVADAPLGLSVDTSAISGEYADSKLRDFGQLLTLWCCNHLSKHGMAAITITLSAVRASQWIKAIHERGCRVRAIINVPVGTRLNTNIATYIVVVDREEQGKVFFGQLSDDEEHGKRLLKNLKRHKSDEHPSLGRIGELESFLSYEALEADFRLKRSMQRTKFQKVSFDDLVEEVSEYNVSDGLGEVTASSTTLVLPRPNGRFYADPSEMPARVKRFLLFKFDRERVHARYLLNWLESEYGNLALQAAGISSMLPLINQSVLARLNCYLPEVEHQRKILDALDKLESVQNEVQEVRSACWSGADSGDTVLQRASTINQEDRYEDWLETLPFPLASILWRHKVSGSDPQVRFGILLHFFEALAEFLATIHLSALSTDRQVWMEVNAAISRSFESSQLSLDRASFGAWKVIVEASSAYCRKQLKGEGEGLVKQLYFSHSTDWLARLCSAELITVINHAIGLRNRHSGHGGAIGAELAQAIEKELLRLVEKVRAVFSRGWLRYELLMPGKMEFGTGGFAFSAARVMGTRNQFEQVVRNTAEPVKTGHLYLLSEGSSAGLELLPFVRLMSSPSTELNACYFYNRTESDGQRFVSYHFEGQPEVCGRFEDAVDAIRLISRSSDQDES